jgi:dTDP-4-dehydrorhamnose reductase
LKKILITGVSGFIGYNLYKYFQPNFEVYGTYFNNRLKLDKCFKLNFEEYLPIKSLVRSIKPDYIINTAAIANPELCENDKNLADTVNIGVPLIFSDLSKNMGFKLIHFSTDLVYPGTKSFNVEKDNIYYPLNYYAGTKYFSERILNLNAKNTVIRLALTYGLGSKFHGGFLKWSLDSLKKKQSLKLFTDQYRTPISVFELYKILYKIILKDFTGLLNVGSDERISRYDFGLKLCEFFKYDKSLIEPIEMNSIENYIPRPADASLDISKLKNDLDYTPQSVENSLKDIFV